jgi:hypothetical protein
MPSGLSGRVGEQNKIVDAEAVEIVLGRVDEALRRAHEGAHILRGSEVVNELLDLRIAVAEANSVDWGLPVVTPSRRVRRARTLPRLPLVHTHAARSA